MQRSRPTIHMAAAIGYGGMRLFANGYVSLFIIPYGGKPGSGLNPLRDFVKIDIWRWNMGGQMRSMF